MLLKPSVEGKSLFLHLSYISSFLLFPQTSSKNSVKADPRPELKVTATTVHTYDKPLQRKHVKSGALDPVLVPGGVAIETNKRRKDAKVIPEPDWREIRLDWKQLPSSYLKLSKARLTSK